MSNKGGLINSQNEQSRLIAMLRNLEIKDKAHNNVYGEFLTSNAILACQYGAKKQTLGKRSLKYTKIGSTEVLIDKDMNIVGTFGVCNSPRFAGLSSAKTIQVSASESLDGVAKPVSGHMCYMQLAQKWGSLTKEVVVYDSITKEYREIPTTNSYILCHYGGGCIYPIDSGQRVTINTGGSGYIITSKMMQDFGWSISSSELKLLNDTLQKYGITDENSIRLFMATCAHESGKGTIVLEKLNANGTTVGNYLPTERGAGYIQLTWRATHLKFLATIPDTFSGTDTATYISQNYPWQAAAWFWTSKDAKTIGTSPSLTIDEYVEQYGDSSGVYLLTQYAVNGWAGSPSNTILSDIRVGIISWTIANGRVLVNGVDVGKAPNGWNDATNSYNRENTYNEAIMHFQ